MGTLTEMQAAAFTKLRQIAGRPETVFPNQPSSRILPRLEAFCGPSGATLLLLDGTSQINFLLQIDVVVEDGTYSSKMDELVALIEGAFLVGDAVGLSGEVSGHPVSQGYRQDGTEYRCSVTIPITGFF